MTYIKCKCMRRATEAFIGIVPSLVAASLIKQGMTNDQVVIVMRAVKKSMGEEE